MTTPPAPPTPGPGRTRSKPGRGRLLWAALAAIAVVLAAAGILWATRGGDGAPDPDTSAATAPTGSPAPSASPSPSLPADQQQAVDEAAAAVLAYEQRLVDLYAAEAPILDDLAAVAVEPQLGIDTRALTQFLGEGTGTIDSTGPVALGPTQPVEVALDSDPPTVVLDVCVDQTAVTGSDAGVPWTGQRQLSQYRLVSTGGPPAGGWAVAQVLPPTGYDQPQPC